MKPIDNGRVVDAITPEGCPHIVRIFEPGKNNNESVGSALLCIYDDYCEILHIFVEPKFRGQGYAKDLVREIQSKQDYIITGWSSSEPAARELLFGMGFTLKKHIVNGRKKTMEWEK